MTIASLSFEVEVVLWLGVAIVGFGIAAWCALPTALRTRSEQCANRRDGSLSRRRRQIEIDLRTKFVVDAMGTIVLAALPVLFTGFLIHQWIVPAGLAAKAIPSVFADPDPSSPENQQHRRESTTGLARDGHSEESIRMIQSAAWNGWPVFLAAMLLICLGSVWFLLASIKRLVRRFQRALDGRCREYGEVDLADFERELQPAQESAPTQAPGKSLA